MCPIRHWVFQVLRNGKEWRKRLYSWKQESPFGMLAKDPFWKKRRFKERQDHVLESLFFGEIKFLRSLPKHSFQNVKFTWKSRTYLFPWLVWLRGLSAGLWAKGSRFDSLPGHMPGLPAGSPFGGKEEATNQCFSLTSMFLPLSFCLSSLLSENK